MLYRRYGKDGPLVSVLGFGAMRLPLRAGGDYGRVNYTRATEVIRRALHAGVNFIDTHHRYHEGHSEEAVGRALKGWKGPRVYLQTKTPFYDDKPAAHFERMLYEALEKLGVAQIDYLLFHSVRMDRWKKRGRRFLKFSDWALRKGLIVRRGFSSHDTPENVKTYIDTGAFSAALMSYNWLNRRMADTIAYAADRGMGVSVMNPLGGGSLAAATPKILGLLPGARSAPEVALRYVLATPGVTAAFSGMSDLAQVDENARLASRPQGMTPAQWKAMNVRLAAIERKGLAVCTSCGYCMPCPHGVSIPVNFMLYNRARFLDMTEWAGERFEALRKHAEGDRSALACRKCGACLPKCPARVPIVRQLERTAAMLTRR